MEIFKNLSIRTHSRLAFTRLDLMVLIGMSLLLSTWTFLGRIGERGRIARCAATLSVLGQGLNGFANDHGDALPPASIEPQRIAWDTAIAPYLPRDLAKKGWRELLQCPSDRAKRSDPRSYAMSAYDMEAKNWPPAPGVATGVGLVWNKDSVLRLLGDQAAKIALTNTDFLAMVKRSVIPAPANTVVLTELNNSSSQAKDLRLATINGPGVHLEQVVNGPTNLHYGRFNYLMMDGHIELLSPLQASKIWNISKSD